MAEGGGRPARAGLAQLFATDAGFDEFAFAAPLFWPDLPADDAAAEWVTLRAWVQRLVVRYELDSHVVPACWYRHNHFVEALAALRDHERASFAPTAAPTSAVDWQRALRDIEARLRAWAAELRCDSAHDPAHDRTRTMTADDWDEWLTADVNRRRLAAVDAACLDG